MERVTIRSCTGPSAELTTGLFNSPLALVDGRAGTLFVSVARQEALVGERNRNQRRPASSRS